MLALGRTGGFPNARTPRVLWIGLREEGHEMAPLQVAVEEAMVPLGWPRERRAFQPHLTVGRTREAAPGRPRKLPSGLLHALASSGDTLPVRPQERFALVRSHLSPQGARYEDVRVWTLA
jgi:2'-5' RNA ligase